ncbi:Aste57867_10301 [Aphanomyces stellatus]|uniref:Aste57867_10301 protein n=1 Tax=Aphanomyces stellatus TaxID=120398 RepID=A0A485KQT0_9STRA|nr:hypothetical protein As57867_010261 [Aphanomyces stellatus]VFT87175.1 Aste57867_10301 [Aphanomyces stellatus]
MQGDVGPNLGAIAIDYTNNPHSIFGHAICGSPECIASLEASIATYPLCDVFPAYYWSANAWAVVQPISYASSLMSLLDGCTEFDASIAPAGNGECLVGDNADYKWAKYHVTLSPNCVVFCGAGCYVVQCDRNWIFNSPVCLLLTSTTTSQLSNCTVQPGHQSHFSTPCPHYPGPLRLTLQPLPRLSDKSTCDTILQAANQWTLSQFCADTIVQGGIPPSLTRIAIDYSSNYNSIFGFCICANYQSCRPVLATSYLSTLSTLLNACPRLLKGVASGSNTCMVADYASYKWAKFQVTLTPNCAADLGSFGYSASSVWYSVVQAVPLTQPTALTAMFCASQHCLSQTTTVLRALADCNVTSGENLFQTTSYLLAYYSSHSTARPITKQIRINHLKKVFDDNSIDISELQKLTKEQFYDFYSQVYLDQKMIKCSK